MFMLKIKILLQISATQHVGKERKSEIVFWTAWVTVLVFFLLFGINNKTTKSPETAYQHNSVLQIYNFTKTFFLIGLYASRYRFARERQSWDRCELCSVPLFSVKISSLSVSGNP